MDKESAARDERRGAGAEEAPGEAALDVAEVVAVPEGADAACWAHIVCPECGSVLSEGHRPGCSQPADG